MSASMRQSLADLLVRRTNAALERDGALRHGRMQ